jgi:hypothetical protein
VRILDWGHAAASVVAAGQAVFGVGTPASQEWVVVQVKELRTGDAQVVVGKLRGLRDELMVQVGEESAVYQTVAGSVQYLETRQEHIRYATFQTLGYPIGSGSVESANKLVVEARLKGAGMHWARGHVDGMVALRTIACNERWDEAWPQISAQLRREVRERSAARRAKRRAEKAAWEIPAATGEEASISSCETPTVCAVAAAPPVGIPGGKKRTATSRRPAADHPWRHMPVGRARRR